MLKEARLPIEKIIIAASIFEIKKDKDLIAVCIHEFQQIQDPNTLVASFYYLVRFDDYSTNKLIEHYSNDENYLVSYNAKRAISLGKSEYR
jgi:hypothetical protein